MIKPDTRMFSSKITLRPDVCKLFSCPPFALFCTICTKMAESTSKKIERIARLSPPRRDIPDALHASPSALPRRRPTDTPPPGIEPGSSA